MPKGLAGYPKAATNYGRMSRPFIEGWWMTPALSNSHVTNAGQQNPTFPSVQCTPLLFDVPVLIDGWYTKVGVSQASSTVEVGIYTVKPGGRPDTLITRLGLVDTSTTGDKIAACNPVYIPAGDAYAVFMYVVGHFGIRNTSTIFTGFSTVGLCLQTGFSALPQRFTGSEIADNSSGQSAPFIAFKINKVLA